VIDGVLSEQQKTDILASLHEDEFFIPGLVGLPEKRFDDYIDDLDHPWFELIPDAFSETDEKPTVNITAEALTSSFLKLAGNWESDLKKPYLSDLLESSSNITSEKNTWVTVYKDALGHITEYDNLTSIKLPTDWLEKKLKSEGISDLEAWLNEYTADNTIDIAVAAIAEKVILECSDKSLCIPLADKSLPKSTQNDLTR